VCVWSYTPSWHAQRQLHLVVLILLLKKSRRKHQRVVTNPSPQTRHAALSTFTGPNRTSPLWNTTGKPVAVWHLLHNEHPHQPTKLQNETIIPRNYRFFILECGQSQWQPMGKARTHCNLIIDTVLQSPRLPSTLSVSPAYNFRYIPNSLLAVRHSHKNTMWKNGNIAWRWGKSNGGVQNFFLSIPSKHTRLLLPERGNSSLPIRSQCWLQLPLHCLLVQQWRV